MIIAVKVNAHQKKEENDMPELNRDKIMKCLRHCNGGDCETCKVLETACDASWTFHKDALTLIKQLTEEKREIFEEIEKLFDEVENYVIGIIEPDFSQFRDKSIADLKKKYIGEVTENE